MEQRLHVNNLSSPKIKIALFRSLFRGREDVYSRRFENKKTGKSGYVFVCSNEWVRGICEKPKIKCSDCKYRQLSPITDEIIHWHLSGLDNHGKDFVMGMYPMLLDETCFFLAADFDKADWKEDAAAFTKTCREMGLPVALERSRSGKGAHVWLFFEEAIQAALARKLGCHILTETMENRPDIGLESYDRLFPNQDTLPQGGLGNLIALPLQKKARLSGNSVFVDEYFTPYEDQWTFLSNLRKITRSEVENIVNRAETKGRIVGVRLNIHDEELETPWNLPPSKKNKTIPIENAPEKLELVIGNQIYISKESLSPSLRNRLIRLAAFQNPEFYKAQALRFPTNKIPRIISCAEDYPKHIALPRGCFDEVYQLLIDLKINVVLRHEFYEGEPLSINFQGELKPQQQAAAEAMLAHHTGVLSATTAFGKTVIGSWLIANRKVNTLILVHRKQLQEQWIERLSLFLDIPRNKIGKVGGGSKKPKGFIDVALIQSLVRQGVVNDIVSQYGHLIVDECHHLPAISFEQVVRQAKAKYITGLTATLRRKDGHHPIITMQCGPVRYHVDPKEQAAARPFDHLVMVRPTPFISIQPTHLNSSRIQFNHLYDELIRDVSRNKFICDDVINALKNGRSPLLLTERNEHLDLLSYLLAPHVRHLIVLRGGMSNREITKVTQRLESVPENEERLLLATGKYIGEGFDDARLDTLFLTMPVSWQGTISQYVGRLHRLYESKREVQVYDYADLNVPILERMFNRRCRGYEAVGYKILLPASAVPGWPAQIPLPVDPAWKSQYAASVRRLIHDGVDLSLANLFVKSSVHADLDSMGGVERARSPTEAFFYRRLETLPETRGKFQLNALLSIPFDAASQMEVDFICSEANLVVEIDGAQHLADQNAYRRDRHKDALLQQNGYMVLRFLAEDVAKYLDDILNSILRTLAYRCRTHEKIAKGNQRLKIVDS